MAFGFPARFVERRTYPDPEDILVGAIESALSRLGWAYSTPWDKEFQASIPISGWSWGEQLNVKLLAGSVIQAESKCAGARAQLFDFGKNKKNVRAFFDQLEQSKEPSVDGHH